MNRERDALGIGDLTYNADGLIPAVVQDAASGEVLMVAYMNEEALARTLATGRTWFWSRSRKAFWQKGETSGHTQAVREVRYDCDADALLITVDQIGAACHTGEKSCFYRELAAGDATHEASAVTPGAPRSIGPVLDDLFATLAQRKRDLPEGSYTTKLLTGNVDSLLKKIAEESGEVIMAAKDGDREHLIYEIGDLVYHLLVVMTREGVSLEDLAAELEGRKK